ncbi:hypothetical protein [Mesorhizobium sp. B1-1-8]|uniref:hypothetical protein n=1 Tax=Mesorhizobium sp. B1-1-8 TaxID=2589976 RepID=UPI001AEF34F3|nr:hypothetical protein [Mesorhizobium sp. B1-1-8]UCI07187.1 hypothetical protein FJ974_25925 [Mesorhizobium sp. B1-1-8]
MNGIFMLALPADWYLSVPGVTTTGPFNQHFVRDIGLVFLFVGAAFLIGVARPRLRLFLWAAPTFWVWGHVLSGRSPLAFVVHRRLHVTSRQSRCPQSSARP